ncbi:MAG: hypothetical protein KDH88_09185 [Chromatiales bacterium]|nr:hypothetical protein [Chromatiales bacterium]
MKPWPRLLAAISIILLSGCGYHLRGADRTALPASLKTVYLQAQPFSELTTALRLRLDAAGSDMVEGPGRGVAVISLSGERFDQGLITLSGDGRSREYQLTYQVQLAVQGAANMTPQRVSLVRSYLGDERDRLGQAEQQELLRVEMARELADQIVYRLRAL